MPVPEGVITSTETWNEAPAEVELAEALVEADDETLVQVLEEEITDESDSIQEN